MDTELDNMLAHYGVKGMRWGVRRSKKELERAREAAKSPEARAAEAALSKAAETGVSSLSNDELKVLNERLNLEQNFTRLTTVPKEEGKVKNGIKAAKNVLEVGSTVNQAIAFVNSPAGKILRKTITS